VSCGDTLCASPTPIKQSLQAAKLCDDLAVLSDEKPYITYPELIAFIKQQ